MPLVLQITYGVPRLSVVQDRSARCPGDDAAGFQVGGAALGHLQVVDLGQLGVLAAGGVSGADERRPQLGWPGLAHRLALAVRLAGLAGSRGEPDIGLEPGPVTEPARAAHRGDQDRCADLGEPGQRPGQLPRVDLPVVLFAGRGVDASSAWMARSSRISVATSVASSSNGTAGDHRKVDGSSRSGQPLPGSCGALLMPGHRGDQAGQLGFTGPSRERGSA